MARSCANSKQISGEESDREAEYEKEVMKVDFARKIFAASNQGWPHTIKQEVSRR